jgi:hypothetical protein
MTSRKRSKNRLASAVSDKNSGENSGSQASAPPDPPPELRPQAHGGALLPGGKRGNKGGGRTPNAVREVALEHFANRLSRLDRIASGRPIKARVGELVVTLPATVKEQGAAIIALGRLGGMATKIEVEASGAGMTLGVLRDPDAPPLPSDLPPGGPDAPTA